MDLQTVTQYNLHASSYLADWVDETPEELCVLISQWFERGSSVLDVGAGGGRDVAWMLGQGFRARGVDASTGLIAVAKQRYPKINLTEDRLPSLALTPNDSEDNIFCSAVLMHLPDAEVLEALTNIMRVVKPGGRIICSVRRSRDENVRESDGRLFTSINFDVLSKNFESVGGSVLMVTTPQAANLDRVWRTIVVQKNSRAKNSRTIVNQR